MFKLTTTSVKKRCRPSGEGETNGTGKTVTENWYWDTEDRGFFLVMRRRTATLFVQKDVRGKSRRVKIGRYPTWTVDQARKRARELIVQMDQGIDPNAQKREAAARGTTLREARQWHVASMRARKCAERSVKSILYETNRHVVDWLDRPLADIRPNEWFLGFHCLTKYVKVAFLRGASLRPVPPVASKQEHARYLHIHEDDPADDEQFESWVRQASELPGEELF